MSRIFVCGDTHAGQIGDLTKLTSRKFPIGKELTKDDYVIVLGDFGFLWSMTQTTREKDKFKWFHEKPWTTLFLDGNHENHQRLDNLETVKMFGNPVGKVNDSIFHLRRGYVYNIGGKSFFTFGGGYSIDKERRTENISWWAREMPSIIEYERGFLQLGEVDNKVDYILTHSCSNDMFDELASRTYMNHKIFGEGNLRNYFDVIRETVEHKMWFFGHFHYDYLSDNNWQVMYNLVKEIE